METELKVVNMGNRGGKVVRRSPVCVSPAYARTPQTLYYAVRAGAITLMEVQWCLSEMGSSPHQVAILLSVMASMYFHTEE